MYDVYILYVHIVGQRGERERGAHTHTEIR